VTASLVVLYGTMLSSSMMHVTDALRETSTLTAGYVLLDTVSPPVHAVLPG